MGGTEEDREGEVGCGSAPGTGKRSSGEGGEERLPAWKLFDERREEEGVSNVSNKNSEDGTMRMSVSLPTRLLYF